MLNYKRPLQIISFIERWHLPEKGKESILDDIWLDFIWVQDLEILIWACWVQINVLLIVFNFFFFAFKKILNWVIFRDIQALSVQSFFLKKKKEWKLFLRPSYSELKMIKSGQSMFVVSFSIATKNKSFRRTFFLLTFSLFPEAKAGKAIYNSIFAKSTTPNIYVRHFNGRVLWG